MKRIAFVALAALVLAGCQDATQPLVETEVQPPDFSILLLPTRAELTVVRVAAETYRFSSRSIATRVKPSVICRFRLPIRFAAPDPKVVQVGGFTTIGFVGTPQADGSLVVDRSDYLAIPRKKGAVAILLTNCGPSVTMLAKTLLERIEPLGIGQRVTMRIVYI